MDLTSDQANAVIGVVAVALIWASIQVLRYVMESHHYSWHALGRDIKKALRRS